MLFTIKTEQNNKITFLDVNFICERGKFTTSNCRKPTLSSVYTHFESFLPNNSFDHFGTRHSKIGVTPHIVLTLLSYRKSFCKYNWT